MTGPLPPARPAANEGVQAVAIALQVLEYLAQQRESVGVTALAVALGISKSRVHRHLRTLVDHGYVLQAADSERYRVGMRLVTLGRAVSDNFDLPSLARPAMRALRDDLGHSVALSQPDPEGARVVATLSGSSAVEIGVKPGSLLAFHSSAQGKIMLAFGEPALRMRGLRARLEMMTPRTIVSSTALQAEIARVARQGWAGAPGESVLGVNTLAAPLFDGADGLVGAIAVVDSMQFIEDQPAPALIDRLLTAAGQISRAIGHDPARQRRRHAARTDDTPEPDGSEDAQ